MNPDMGGSWLPRPERGRPVVPVTGKAIVTVIVNGQEIGSDTMPDVAWNVLENRLEITASFELFQMERK